MTGLVLFVLLLLFAFLGGWLWKYSYKSLEFPRYAAPSGDHPFGTDGLGADMLAQVLRGARTSMTAVLWVVVEATIIGAVVGRLVGALRRGSRVAGGVGDLVLAGCAVALIVMAADLAFVRPGGPAWLRLAPLLAVVLWQVTAAVFRLFRERFPPTADLVVTSVALAAGFVILREGSRSFLGLGVRPPETELGLQLFVYGQEFGEHPLLFFVPFAVFTSVVLAVFLLGIGVRAALRSPAGPPPGGLPERRPAAVAS